LNLFPDVLHIAAFLMTPQLRQHYQVEQISNLFSKMDYQGIQDRSRQKLRNCV